MFSWRADERRLTRAVTDRWGGRSTGPFAEFNLSFGVGDDPGVVAANRSQLAGAVGVDADRLLFMRQVHGGGVHVASSSTGGERRVDAMVTREPDVALAVLAADCVPVLLADDVAGVIGVAHVGRPGLVAGVLDRVVSVMGDEGARDLGATIGPSVCGRCYEVPAEMQCDVGAVVPAAVSRSATGTAALDIAAGVRHQLAALGVAVVEHVEQCTRESAHLFSYRRDTTTGRIAGVIVRRSA